MLRTSGFYMRDPMLTDKGLSQIEWVLLEMPFVGGLRGYFVKSPPLRGLCISACLPVRGRPLNATSAQDGTA